MIEVKPCPFCGGVAASKVTMLNEKNLEVAAGCARCNVWYSANICLPTTLVSLQNVIDRVVNGWNRRNG